MSKLKRVFTHKSKLFLILVGMILALSCESPLGDEGTGGGSDGGGGSGGEVSGGEGAGGGQTVGSNNYTLHKGSLSQIQQRQLMDPNNNSKVLFKKGDYGSKYFRIPALICTSNGTILAAADRRYEKTADLGKSSKIDVIVRRSEDLGTTWSNPIVVAHTATGSVDSYGDAFFINCHNGDVLCGFITEPGIQQNGKGETVIYRSKDDGKTWTKQWSFLPTAINDANKGFGASGQGLTLRHGINAGAKKLMFAYFQWNKSGGLSVTAMVSDNDGVNFTRYGNVKPSDNNIDETKAIELSDGSIMFNHRKGVSQGGRAWSKSTDGGKNWTYQGIDGEVLDPGNNADFSRYEFNGRYIKTAKHILMINANVAKANSWFTARKNHTIRMTANDFGNGNGTSTGKYIYTKQLVNGGENLYSGYPSITVLPDGTIATLTEETTVNEQDAYDIVFRRFNLCWLSGGKEYVNYDTDNLFQYKN